jgi:hypothetical protein
MKVGDSFEIICSSTYDDAIWIIPAVSIYFHSHTFGNVDKRELPKHFHICIEWIRWFIELRIGRDCIGE